MNKSNSSRVKKESSTKKKPSESIPEPDRSEGLTLPTGTPPVKERKKPVEYPLFKYLEIEAPKIDKYERAYVEARYRGILKSEEEWRKILKPIAEVKDA